MMSKSELKEYIRQTVANLGEEKKGTELGDKFIILGPNKETEEALALAIKEKVLMTAKIKGD